MRWYSLSSMLIASVFGALLPMLGLTSVFIIMSAMHVLVGLAAVTVLHNPPEDFMANYNGPGRSDVPSVQQCSTLKDCLQSKVFWLFFFLNFCKTPAYTLVNSNFVSNAAAHHVGEALAVTGVSIASLMQLGGRLMLSGLSDKLGGRVLIIAAYVCMAVGVLLCPFSSGFVYLLVLWLMSFGFGGFTSLNNAALAEYLGTQGYGLIISLCSFGYGISSLVTTYLFKRLSFSGALSAAAATAMIGLTLAVLLPKLKKVTAGSLAAAGAEKR